MSIDSTDIDSTDIDSTDIDSTDIDSTGYIRNFNCMQGTTRTRKEGNYTQGSN
jgi:hypothetical protein